MTSTIGTSHLSGTKSKSSAAGDSEIKAWDNILSCLHPREINQRSDVWSVFQRVQEGAKDALGGTYPANRVCCTWCVEKYPSVNPTLSDCKINTTNFCDHLKNKHKNEWETLKLTRIKEKASANDSGDDATSTDGSSRKRKKLSSQSFSQESASSQADQKISALKGEIAQLRTELKNDREQRHKEHAETQKVLTEMKQMIQKLISERIPLI